MKAARMRELTQVEIGQQCLEKQKELFQLIVRKSSAQIEKPSRIRALRREIARAKTIIREQSGSRGEG